MTNLIIRVLRATLLRLGEHAASKRSKIMLYGTGQKFTFRSVALCLEWIIEEGTSGKSLLRVC
jgi:hypothetical protein